MTKLLLTSTKAAYELRKVHDQVVSSKAQIEGFKLLKAAVNKEKAGILDPLTKRAHSKDVEFIKPIEGIKEAYEVALKKGMVYVKKFTGALQKNYSFTFKLTKGLTELNKIAVKFKTADQVLSSEEWRMLGSETQGLI